ncbi:MAG: hypothetical protein RLZZ101_1072 [Pseudomonadota bacterium]
MAISTVWIEAIVTLIGRPSGPWRWGGDNGWDPRRYWHPVELGGICRENRQIFTFPGDWLEVMAPKEKLVQVASYSLASKMGLVVSRLQ